jgi:PAS domain S-box-containing protein
MQKKQRKEEGTGRERKLAGGNPPAADRCAAPASERDRPTEPDRDGRLELERRNLELQRSSEELQRSSADMAEIAERYADLFDYAPVGLFLLDEGYRVIEANLMGLEMLGRERADVLGRDFRRWLPTGGGPFHGLCRLTLERRRSTACELDLTRGDGTRMRAWVETAPVIGRSDRLRLAVSDLGGRERTDTEWRHNSELLDSIVDTIPVMIAVYDPNLRRFTLNREFRQVLGWTEEDLESGDPMIMCYPDPDYREMVRCYMESLEPGWRDFRVRAKGGGFVDSTWANIRLSDETHIGIGIDMRGRRAADLELRESRERLRLATEAAGLGVFEWHIATDRAVWENPRMYEIFGRTAEEGPLSKAEFVRRVIHPDDAAEFERQLAAAAMSEAPWRTTVRTRAADGSLRSLEALGAFVFNEGQPQRLVGVVADVTDRVRIEGELREYQVGLERRVQERTRQLQEAFEALQAEAAERLSAENRLRQISRVFMDAADPIIIEDPSGVIMEVNREAEGAYGWSRSELIGRSIRMLFPPAGAEHALSLRKRCLEGEEIRNAEDLRVDRSGRAMPVLVTAFPLYDGGDRVVAVATIAKDISRLKEAEHQLQESRNQLQDLSRKSIEALEADRRSVSRELHDSIGGSLAALKYMLEEMAEQASTPGSGTAAPLEQAIAYLTETIRETKRISVNLRPLTLDDLGLVATFKSHLRQFRDHFQAIRVTSEIEIREADVPDSQKIVLYRLLQESLVNVAKHSGADQVRVRLSKHAGGEIAFEVCDNGSGFDPRQRSAGRTPLGGYGLKSMQERVEICRGSFTVDSRPGGGTCVRAVFPAEPPQGPAEIV